MRIQCSFAFFLRTCGVVLEKLLMYFSISNYPECLLDGLRKIERETYHRSDRYRIYKVKSP